MSAYYGDGQPAGPTQEAPMHEPWERTPWWHIARWFGLGLRRYNNHPLSGGWDYSSPKRVARLELERRYGGQTNMSGTGEQRRSANWIGAGNHGWR